MKLRNKETGEIEPATNVAVGVWKDGKWYDSLAELCEEFEDYEEPEGYWCIDWDGGINHINLLGNPEGEHEEKKKQIGNYFESREEAEKAVEKLKAWKRLKDAGFEFKGWKVLDHDSPRIYFNVYRKNTDDIVPYLDMLFGGEE